MAQKKNKTRQGKKKNHNGGRWLGIICLALIVLVGVFAYWDSFKVPFVLDDDPIIATNPNLREFGSTITGTYHSRVVGFLTFALNYKINGLDVTGYHILNLAIHLASALLVFWLVTLTLKTPFLRESRLGRPASVPVIVALFCALIFVAHPVQTQAVTYIVQRFASLATLFYLLAVVMYAKWRLSADDPAKTGLLGGRLTVDLPVKRGLFYAASLAATLLAMGTKENAVTLPVVLALWEFSFFGGAVKKRLVGLLPFTLTLPVIPLVQVISGVSLTSAPGAPGVTSPPAAIDYFLTQSRVIVTYIRLLFFPSGQNLDYDYPVYRSFLDPNVFLSFVFLLLVAGLGVFLWRHAKREAGYAPLRLIAFGIFWFFITSSVESSFITIADVIFEHRLYLPSAGLIIAVVVAVAMATESLKERVAWVEKAVIPLGAAVVVALSLAAFSRNQVWADPITLWEDTVAKSPGKARPHHNLGYYFQQNGQTERAEAEYLRAIELQPDYVGPMTNLGVIYKERGEIEKAEAAFRIAIDIDPNNALAHNNLGTIYQERGEFEKATAGFLRAIELNPDFTGAYYNLGMSYVNNNQYTEAINPFRKAAELKPDYAEAHNNLGNIFAIQGNYDKALAEYKAALAINPDYQEARENIQLLLSIQGGTGASGR